MKSLLLAAAIAATFTVPALAQSIEIDDPYARTSRPGAPSGAIFMMLKNMSDTDDRLVAAQFEGARKTELHTHEMNAETGVARMIEVEEGFELPAKSMTPLARGGNHIMLMGLEDPLEEGGMISVTLTFEQAGEIEIMVPVDSSRDAGHGHGGHGHGHKHGHDGHEHSHGSDS
ncbi:MAG: copper chaperone PCu(A)C [Pseudomonadota bacterium]